MARIERRLPFPFPIQIRWSWNYDRGSHDRRRSTSVALFIESRDQTAEYDSFSSEPRGVENFMASYEALIILGLPFNASILTPIAFPSLQAATRTSVTRSRSLGFR